MLRESAIFSEKWYSVRMFDDFPIQHYKKDVDLRIQPLSFGNEMPDIGPAADKVSPSSSEEFDTFEDFSSISDKFEVGQGAKADLSFDVSEKDEVEVSKEDEERFASSEISSEQGTTGKLQSTKKK